MEMLCWNHSLSFSAHFLSALRVCLRRELDCAYVHVKRQPRLRKHFPAHMDCQGVRKESEASLALGYRFGFRPTSFPLGWSHKVSDCGTKPHLTAPALLVILDLLPSGLSEVAQDPTLPYLEAVNGVSPGIPALNLLPSAIRGHPGGGGFSESLLGNERGCPPCDHHGYPVLQWQDPRVSWALLCFFGNFFPKTTPPATDERS